jgi:Domain of unknown function (DUF3303)
MLHVAMDTETSNELVASGKMGSTIEGILAKLEPEAAYFHPADGRRGFTLVIDAPDGATLPSLVEPLWQQLGATVEAVPVMNAAELGEGLSRLG